MSRTVKLKKGYDIRLEGVAEKKLAGTVNPVLYGVKPTDFPGLVPKLEVGPGDTVDAGTPLFHDKLRPEVKFTSPVSGKVISVNRGERRQIMEVVVESEGSRFREFGNSDPLSLPDVRIKEKILQSGLWPAIRQRPYHVIANAGESPKSIFISGFDTAPLAPDYNFIVENSNLAWLQTGIKALSKLTSGSIYVSLNADSSGNSILETLDGVVLTYFSGPHPAGNVGVQIHHVDPVNKGETVWYINLQDVFALGRLFEEGIYRPERVIALTGSEVIAPQYYRMISGGSLKPLAEGKLKQGGLRCISGNVLTGRKTEPEGFLGFYDSQVTVIPEGDYSEFFGWAAPGAAKLSFSRTFLSSLFPRKVFRPDTNLHGGERAFVVTGLYEKVVPMDIYPMHLFKAILAEDIDMMENLGIYEVAEEDFALCEFVCPSKIEIQSIIRKGLDLMRNEMS